MSECFLYHVPVHEVRLGIPRVLQKKKKDMNELTI